MANSERCCSGNRYRAPEEVTGHWLLSLFSPASDDSVDWQQGNYRVVARTGRVESASGWGPCETGQSNDRRRRSTGVAHALKGVARDVAPAGFPHPVYRAGFALSIPIGKPRPQQQPSKAAASAQSVVVNESLLESLATPVATVPEPAPTTIPKPVPTTAPEALPATVPEAPPTGYTVHRSCSPLSPSGRSRRLLKSR